MKSACNKFFIQIDNKGYSNLIYCDKETNVKCAMKLNNGLKSEILMKIKLIQPKILIVEGDIYDFSGNRLIAGKSGYAAGNLVVIL